MIYCLAIFQIRELTALTSPSIKSLNKKIISQYSAFCASVQAGVTLNVVSNVIMPSKDEFFLYLKVGPG